ncbi:MAG: oligosaccharide flippase family protein [Clostridium saudiense]|uniref:oligosaccharide flippase family protein n=1 Tax=Clostridium saudiense TaxID=1414720 RepID=UPI002910521E|nr:oligosaccharide flippase family protein [Clostridium saudiense]MDU3520894.1 oligosaccharide flippase family protein [Clostridium saudiense]
MNESHERKNGAILSYFSIILNTFIQLLYLPFLVNKLGDSEYGIYSIVASIMGYLAIMDFGFGDAIVMYTAKYKAQGKFEEEKKLHGMFLVIFSVIGIFTFVFGIIISLNANYIFQSSMTSNEINVMRKLLLILAFNLGITFPFNVYSSIINAYERFTFRKIISIFNSILQPLIMIPLLFLGYKAVALTVVITLLNLFILLSNWYYCRTKLKIKIKYYGFDFKIFRKIISYSFYIFLNMIVDKINWSTDQFVLGMFSGTTAVTLYSIASRVNEMFIKLSSAISGVLFPKISKMVASNVSDKRLSEEFIKTGRLQFIIIFLMGSGLVLFGKEFFVLWVGQEYVNAYYIALILILPLSVPLIQNLGISILQAKNLHKFRSLLYLAVAVLNIILSVPLTKMYGGIGAAIGTAISLIIGNIVIINIYYYRKAKLNIDLFWRNIFSMIIPIVPLILFTVILMNVIELSGLLKLLIFGCLYTIGYCFIMYFFSMNTYEKSIINKLLIKFKLKKV